ncbi:hypothetical protein E2C01_050413 [Portunus trituberculatus]|uniref:Uncharacterized protein n=1 Tax=Portunus trituberculatus TaxID=210409 RepID=A0A5B7GC11_PORTR|nr:hypothetical protein [Portunus trituberculatus]
MSEGRGPMMAGVLQWTSVHDKHQLHFCSIKSTSAACQRNRGTQGTVTIPADDEDLCQPANEIYLLDDDPPENTTLQNNASPARLVPPTQPRARRRMGYPWEAITYGASGCHIAS